MEVKTRLIFGTVFITALLASVWILVRWIGSSGLTPLDILPASESGKEKAAAAAPDGLSAWTPDGSAFRDKRLERVGILEAPEFDPKDEAGWRIWGRVTRPRSAPVSGVKIVFYSICGKINHPPIKPVFTDDRGRYAAFVPAPEEARLFSPACSLPISIQGQAFASGYFPRVDSLVFLPHPGAEAEPLRLDFALRPGALVSGRVEDSGGHAVEGAFVYILSPDEGWVKVADTRSDGTYELAHVETGTYTVCALDFRFGTARAVSVEFDAARDMEVPPLVLQEYEGMGGQVRYAKGQPFDGLELYVFSTHLLHASNRDLKEYADRFPSREILPPEVEDFRGIPFGKARTQADGRFKMAGLAPGSYFLWAPTLIEMDEGGRLTGQHTPRIPCTAGDHNIIATFNVQNLKVYLRDDQGHLVPEILLSYDSEDFKGSKFVALGETTVQILPGTIRLEASHPDGLYGYAEVVIEKGIPMTRVDLTLR